MIKTHGSTVLCLNETKADEPVAGECPPNGSSVSKRNHRTKDAPVNLLFPALKLGLQVFGESINSGLLCARAIPLAAATFLGFGT
jgi:hypothetical protein